MYVETFWIGGVGTLYMMMGFGMSEVNSAMSDAHSMTSSFISSEVQKKESLDSDLFSISISFSFLISFDDETFSFVFSISEFQKKDSSKTDFVRGDTGEETSFVGGGVSCRVTICCMGAVGIGVSTILCTGAG